MKFILAGLLAILATAASATDITGIIPADTRLIVRIDVGRTIQSPLAKDLQDIHHAKITNLKTFFKENIGFDFMLTEEAWLLSGKPDTGVVLLKGNIDAVEIKGKFGQLPNVTEMKYDGIKYVVKFKDDKKDKWQLGAVLGRDVLAIGDVPSMEHFLKACQGKVETMDADDANVKQIANSRSHLAATLLGDMTAWDKTFDPDIAKVLKGIWFSVDVDADLSAKLTVKCDSERSADGIVKVIEGLIILKGDSKEIRANPLLVRGLKTVTLSRNADVVTITAKLKGTDVQGLAWMQ